MTCSRSRTANRPRNEPPLLVRRAHVPELDEIVLSMAACIEKWDAVDPKSQQPVAGNPCGPLWFPCFDMNGLQNGACCSDGETCGSKWSVGCADPCCTS